MEKYLLNVCELVGYSNTTTQIIEDIVDGLNNGEYEDIDQAINEELERHLIYYEDQWNILKDFCTPQEADFNKAIEELYDFIYYCIYKWEK